jgi:hypothetical protein
MLIARPHGTLLAGQPKYGAVEQQDNPLPGTASHQRHDPSEMVAQKRQAEFAKGRRRGA